MPHRPQFLVSARVLISQPLAGFMSQSLKPPMHCEMAQPPFTQAATPLATMHTLPQAPQLLRLLVPLVSQPLPALLSQFKKPWLQGPRPQAPFTQEAPALAGSGQAMPHILQFLGSLLVSA